jgi:hypothetical protein
MKLKLIHAIPSHMSIDENALSSKYGGVVKLVNIDTSIDFFEIPKNLNNEDLESSDYDFLFAAICEYYPEYISLEDLALDITDERNLNGIILVSHNKRS